MVEVWKDKVEVVDQRTQDYVKLNHQPQDYENHHLFLVLNNSLIKTIIKKDFTYKFLGSKQIYQEPLCRETFLKPNLD